MLLHHKNNLILGGDWNCITENKDCTQHPDQKRSPTLKRLINLHNLKDTYKTLHPKGREFSRYYTSKDNNSGAIRLDRIYTSTSLSPVDAKYLPNPFSDHYSYITKIKTNEVSHSTFVPKPKPSFKIHPKIVDDLNFQATIKLKSDKWISTKK